MKFPDQWGVKKQWPPKYNPNPLSPEPDEEDPDSLINDDGQMKCPECEHWVDHFNYSATVNEYGTVDDEGDTNADDSEFNGIDSITCPSCGREVFESSTSRLRNYYH